MKKQKYCEFGKALLRRMVEKNLTQKELAKRANCERCQISCYVRGVYQPTTLTLMRLCMVLELDISEMAELMERDVQLND